MTRTRALLVAALSAAIWVAALQPWHWYMGDLVVYRGGGHAVLHNLSLYSVVSGRHALHFTYPPFAAVLAVALSWMPLAAAKVVLSALTAIALVLTVRIFLRRVEQESGAFRWPIIPLVLAVAIWLEPVRATFDFGQINAVLMFLVVADVLSLDGRRIGGFRFGGVGVGVAAAIKLTPLAFVPFLLLTGRVRQGLTAIAAFVACGLIGAAVEPGASKTYWLSHHLLSASRIGRVENASNQSLHGVLARLLRTTHVPAWWLVVAAAALIAGLALARTLYRHGRESQAVIVVAIATLCASPVSWSHHWVWCALMAVTCADLVRRSRRRIDAGLAVAVMVPFASGLVFWAPHTAGLELHDSALQQLLSASYVLAGLLLCLLIWRDLSHLRDQRDLPDQGVETVGSPAVSLG